MIVACIAYIYVHMKAECVMGRLNFSNSYREGGFLMITKNNIGENSK